MLLNVGATIPYERLNINNANVNNLRRYPNIASVHIILHLFSHAYFASFVVTDSVRPVPLNMSRQKVEVQLGAYPLYSNGHFYINTTQFWES